MVNLLIALTVNKTEELAKLANTIRLEKTVEQIDHLESLVKQTLVRKQTGNLGNRNQIFFQLKKALGVESKASPWKICVKPFSREEQKKKNAMGRKIVSYHTSINPTSVIKDRNYSIYVYDDRLSKYTVKLPFTMPSGVVRETLAYLRHKKFNEIKKNQQILEREMTSYMDTDKTEHFRKNSIVSMRRVMDNLSASRLPSIHEENRETLEKLEKKIEETKSEFMKMMSKISRMEQSMKQKADQSNQELIQLMSTIMSSSLNEKLQEFSTKSMAQLNKKVDDFNQDLIKLVSTILEDKVREMEIESNQALAQMVKTSLDEKMDTILATLQEATTTHL